MVLSGLQPLHVHGTARSRPRARAPFRRRTLGHELRQPGSSPDTRGRRTEALATASTRWLCRVAGGRCPTGVLRGSRQVGVESLGMTNISTIPSIDEYLRERLMPVEGAIPHIPGIEMFGNSIPAGTVGGDLRSEE